MSIPIRTDQLTKSFPRVEALHGLTLEVPEGSVFALVGPNGAGKTTAIKTLMNVHRPTSGRAEVLGVDSRSLGADQLTQIGYISENQQLPGWMRVSRFLSYCREFYPTWHDEDMAELVHLYKLPLDRTLNTLSRGMRIKAALAYRPRLIMLDEPFGGLDVLVREQLIESILDRSSESTVFLASHDLGEIESFASHIGYLNEGRLEFVEEMASLSDRFREVEITLEKPVELPRDLPATWLNPEQYGVVIRFIDSRFDSEQNKTEIQRRFPNVREVTVRNITLRATFVALAKSAKTNNSAR